PCLPSHHVTAKPPFESAVICAANGMLAVALITITTSPTPVSPAANTCAFTAKPLVSPPAPPTPWLASCHVTTKPPFDSAVICELDRKSAVEGMSVGLAGIRVAIDTKPGTHTAQSTATPSARPT